MALAPRSPAAAGASRESPLGWRCVAPPGYAYGLAAFARHATGHVSYSMQQHTSDATQRDGKTGMHRWPHASDAVPVLSQPRTAADSCASPLPHLRRDRAHRCHICTGTGLPVACAIVPPAVTLLEAEKAHTGALTRRQCRDRALKRISFRRNAMSQHCSIAACSMHAQHDEVQRATFSAT